MESKPMRKMRMVLFGLAGLSVVMLTIAAVASREYGLLFAAYVFVALLWGGAYIYGKWPERSVVGVLLALTATGWDFAAKYLFELHTSPTVIESLLEPRVILFGIAIFLGDSLIRRFMERRAEGA